MVFQAADGDPGAALGGADQDGEGGLHHRRVIRQARDGFRAVVFLDEGVFHRVGGAHVDTVIAGSDGSPAAPQDHPRG